MTSLARRKRFGLLIVVVVALLVGPIAVTAQESFILDAMREGTIGGKSLVAVPEPDTGNAAAEIETGDDSGSTRFLLDLTSEQEKAITDRAFPLYASKWPFNIAYVCWEDPRPEDHDKRRIVREAVEETWEANSSLDFRGWAPCAENSAGIRIAVKDEGPHVKMLGKYVDGMPEGMVLNFTFNNWSTVCQQKLEYCIRVIAVHEFGHAIGFAHEQNRPDTPGECFSAPQGTDGDTTALTPWDPHSVMNYCNPVYSNDGVLSEFDIVALQYIYGMP